MSSTPQHPLNALFAPRSVQLLEPPPGVAVRRRGCRLSSRPQLTVRFRRGRTATATLELGGSAELGRLGPGAGLWTPSLAVAIDRPLPPRALLRRGHILLTQGCTMAEQLLDCAQAQGVTIGAALSVGSAHGSMTSLARVAAQLPAGPPLLVALHRRPDPALLQALAELPSRPALLLCHDARAPYPGRRRGALALDARLLAEAWGIPVASSLRGLMQLGRLAWVRPGALTVARVVARASDEQALIQNTLRRAGMRPAGRGRLRPNLTVQGPLSPEPRCPGTLRVVQPGTRALRAGEANTATFVALGALERLPPPGPTSPRPPAAADAQRALSLLDRWPRLLHELQLAQLLQEFDIASAPAALVTSASRAAVVARRLGLPVVVKALGPELYQRRTSGALQQGLDSLAGVRQAFREVLQACSDMHPSPVLDGVLVQRMVPHGIPLGALVRWGPWERPLLLLRTAPPSPAGDPPQSAAPTAAGTPLARFCPLNHQAATAAASVLLRHAQPDAGLQRAATARLIHRLCRLASACGPRMRWLRVDARVVAAGASASVQVLGAAGEQTMAYRRPPWL